MYFGYTSPDHIWENDGFIEAVGKGGKALLWALSKVEDVHGNYYTIEYAEDRTNGDYYPWQVTYTKNNVAPLAHTTFIRFAYETRRRMVKGALRELSPWWVDKMSCALHGRDTYFVISTESRMSGMNGEICIIARDRFLDSVEPALSEMRPK